ncbi:MAG: hypothetical protein ACI83W_001151 [Marinoscillum sp.]
MPRSPGYVYFCEVKSIRNRKLSIIKKPKLKQLIKKFIPESIQVLIFNYLNSRDYRKWISGGKPFPPPNIVKQKMVVEFANSHGTHALVETGTYLGNMIFAQKKNFKEIYSIELAEIFYKLGVKRFKNHKHISIVLGNSAERLPEIINRAHGKILFWLDGHYSGGDTADSACPVMDELEAIMNDRRSHVILIDDARCFGESDYPSIEEITSYVRDHSQEFDLSIQDDVIRIVYQK